jgi:hypothetical protein
MRSRLLSLAALFLFASAVRADDAADARAIVEKGVKALGHKPGDKLEALTWKDNGKFSGGGMAMPYTGEFAYQWPDKYRFAVNADLEGMKLTFIAIANGQKAWESALGMTREMADEKHEEFMNQVYTLGVTSLLPLLTDKEYKLATAGEKDVNGKKTALVTVTRDKKPAVTLFFDKTTGLLAKSETKVKDEFQGFKEVTQETYFSDYKDANGKKLFGKMKIVRDGKTMIESTLSDQKTADKLDAKLFEKP